MQRTTDELLADVACSLMRSYSDNEDFGRRTKPMPDPDAVVSCSWTFGGSYFPDTSMGASAATPIRTCVYWNTSERSTGVSPARSTTHCMQKTEALVNVGPPAVRPWR